MGENSKIEWTRHTFNPWVGCTKVSPACDFCYAEAWSKRAGRPELWQGRRERTSPSNWRSPLKWDKAAAAAGEIHSVFCASLADVFDNQVPESWRADLFELIGQTPHLRWLLLTKRPQNIRKMLPADWGSGYANVWLGTTAEDEKHFLMRWPFLGGVPALKRFISYEPALGALPRMSDLPKAWGLPDWIIAGGESGGHARPSDTEWFRDVREQCATFGIAFFMKQMTKKAVIPDDLLIRQIPQVA